MSNHERRRLEFLRSTIIDVGAVQHADDVGFDDYGNLVWSVTNAFDEMPPDHKRVIYFDGHSDTVQALRDQWHDKLGGAVDPYDGLVVGSQLDHDALRAQLGYVPPEDEWEHLVFGRGSADQLAGVVAEIVATKIMLELRDEGALHGCIVRAYATAAEEDNDGGGPRHIVDHVLPGAAPELIPDVVVLTEGTGDAVKGALGIYRGQRGRMQIEVTVTGRSCHGSMPAQGLNPLEYGGAILAEAASAACAGRGHARSPVHRPRHADGVVGGARHAERLRGARSVHVPVRPPADRGRVAGAGVGRDRVTRCRRHRPLRRPDRRDRRASVHAAHVARLPGRQRTDLPRVDHPRRPPRRRGSRRCLSAGGQPLHRRTRGRCRGRAALRVEPRVDKWIFSTDGVGFPVPIDTTSIVVPASKQWVISGAVRHPAMFGIGAGIEQNTHRIGECVDERELQHAVAVLARFPRAFADLTGPVG